MNHTELVQTELVRARRHDLLTAAERSRALNTATLHAPMVRRERVSNVSRLRFQAAVVVVGILLTLLIVAVPARAQAIDLGNDGIDLSCDAFPERNAADGYFAHHGRSADRNVDNLDPDGDGVPCNEATEEPRVDGPNPVNDSAGNDSGPVTTLPDTGAGRASADSDPAGPMALVAIMATIGGAVAFEWRRSTYLLDGKPSDGHRR